MEHWTLELKLPSSNSNFDMQVAGAQPSGLVRVGTVRAATELPANQLCGSGFDSTSLFVQQQRFTATVVPLAPFTISNVNVLL